MLTIIKTILARAVIPFRLLFLCSLFLLTNFINAQTTGMAQKVLILVNEARTSPKIFLEKNKKEIEKLNPKFLIKLKTATPINQVIWDEGLVAMANSEVEAHNLHPIYAGKNKMCGESGGNSSGNITTNPLEYVCGFYTNVLDKEYKYLGIYFNKTNTGYSFRWGISCERDKLKLP